MSGTNPEMHHLDDPPKLGLLANPSTSTPSVEQVENFDSATSSLRGVNDKARPAHLAGSGSFVDVAKKEPPCTKTKLYWHNFTSVDETILEQANKLADYESVVEHLRSSTMAAADNRVIVPDETKTKFPYLWSRLELTASLTGSKLIPDPTKTLSLVYGDVWSMDPDIRAAGISALNGAAKTKELAAVQNLAVLIESLGVLPSTLGLQKNEFGKRAQAHLLLTIAGIYSEQKFEIPLTATRRWWRIQSDTRKLLSDDVSLVVGSSQAADLIINAITILYRRFLRQVLSQPEETKQSQTLRKYLENLTHKLCCEGSTLFTRLLTQEHYKKEVMVPDPSKKAKNAMKKEVRTVARLHRPRLMEGPMTPFSAAVLGRVNKVLATIESDAEKVIGPESFGFNLKQWERSISDWVSVLYARTSAFNHVIHERKQYIRNTIFSNRITSKNQTGKTGLREEFQKGISPLEWADAVAAVETRDAELWARRENDAFAQFFLNPDIHAKILEASEVHIRDWIYGWIDREISTSPRPNEPDSS